MLKMLSNCNNAPKYCLQTQIIGDDKDMEKKSSARATSDYIKQLKISS